MSLSLGNQVVQLSASGVSRAGGPTARLSKPSWNEEKCATGAACTGRLTAEYGPVREWWRNGVQGLEQGFEIEHPAGAGDLWIDLAVAGAEAIPEGRGANLQLSDGTALRCTGLFATDATGRNLGARIVAIPGGMRFVVDVELATWPISVDPTYAAFWLASGAGTGDYFGDGPQAAGDVNGDGYPDVVVGAYGAGSQGEVYVYYGSAAGPSPVPDGTLTPTSSHAQKFGAAVAGAGDVNGDGYDDVIVGDESYNNGSAGEGWAGLYLGSASGLATTAAWSSESNQMYAFFGNAVAGAGDVNADGYDDLLVGAYGYDSGTANEGRVSLWYGSATVPAATADWTATSGQNNAYMGTNVAGAGDVNGDGYADVAVAAESFDNGSSDEGQVFVYLGSSTGPSILADWTYDSDQAGAGLGSAVARAGDVNSDGYDDLLIGAALYDNGSTNEGFAWLFHGSASGLAATSSWTIQGNAANAQVGGALAGAGDVDGDGYDDVIVGKETWTSSNGQFYMFAGSPLGLSAVATYTYESAFSGAHLGHSVAGAGDLNGDGYADVLIGAPNYSSNTGLAMVQFGSSTGIAAPDPWSTDFTNGTTLGSEVADAGDLDGDGFGDIAVYGNGAGSSDYAYVYAGSATGLAASADVTLSGSGTFLFGANLASAGDVNHDGYDDLLVSASATEAPYTNEGAVYVYYGSSTGVSSASYSTLLGGQANGYFGYSAESAGDVNGDGFADVIVGAYSYDDGESNEGVAFVFLGSAGGIASTPAWSIGSDQASAILGYSVGPAGDVNGDGYDDVVVGAGYYDDGETNEGAIFLVYGSAAGLETTWSWLAGGDQADAKCSLARGIGDANGDGYADMLRGCSAYDGLAGTNSGRLDLWFGSATGPASASDWSYEAEFSNSDLGAAIAPAGDLNGDGLADLVVGASGADQPLSNEGAVHVFLGSAGGFSDEPDVTFAEHVYSGALGASVSGSHDVDGDGYLEILVGASGSADIFAYEFGDDDGDGEVAWIDCDDADATRYHGASEVCDGADNDCDGEVDEEYPSWYADSDGDGYGDPGVVTLACTAPSGTVSDGSDCDDTDGAVHPGAAESCNSTDDDCDSEIDEAGATGTSLMYADGDSDGYGDPAASSLECASAAGYVANALDCDDTSGAISPDAAEYCDGVDNDCDGDVDEGDAIDAMDWYADADADGYGTAGVVETACDEPAGFVDNAADCDDGDSTISPVGTESCNGTDDDCDGTTDDGVVPTWYADVDGDGYGTPATHTDSCSAPAMFVANNADCDDGDAAISPASTESCNGVDDDCDGSTDEGLTTTYYSDSDGDGYGDVASPFDACTLPSGYATNAVDCDDSKAGTHPGATETCDGSDEDCDGTVDDGVTRYTWYADVDGDGFGDASVSVSACGEPAGYVSDGTDCDDSDGAVNPDATEVRDNGLDDDCDGVSEASSGSGDTGDTGDTAGDTAETGVVGETGDTGAPPDTGDTAQDSGETGAPTDTGDSGGSTDTSDTAEGGDTGGDDSASDGPGSKDSDDTCGCDGSESTALLLPVGLLLLAIRRRRREEEGS